MGHVVILWCCNHPVRTLAAVTLTGYLLTALALAALVQDLPEIGETDD